MTLASRPKGPKAGPKDRNPEVGARGFIDICQMVVLPQSRLAEDISQFPLTSSCKNEIGAKRLKQLKSPEMVLKSLKL